MGYLITMIELSALTVGYAGNPVTPEISGSIAQGCMLAIVGENGCGKSTLLKTLAGFIPAVSGEFSWSPARPVIGWLAQGQTMEAQFPVLVQDVVAMGLWPELSLFRSVSSSKRQRIEGALERVGIRELAKTPIDALSGGQFQRMLFARVWLQHAPLVMLDEPFTGVDEGTTNTLMSLMEEMCQRGQTILAVLHDTPRTTRYFTDVLRLNRDTAQWCPLTKKDATL